jgi:hypothetical protein
MTADGLFSTVLDELADRVAARIMSARGRETYSSHDRPPRTTRRRFAELCRSGRVVGARRDGRDWVCSRDAWHAARVRKVAPPLPATTSLDAKADALLARAGLRVVKGAR